MSQFPGSNPKVIDILNTSATLNRTTKSSQACPSVCIRQSAEVMAMEDKGNKMWQMGDAYMNHPGPCHTQASVEDR